MKYTATVTNLPDGMTEIVGELSWESFAAFEKKSFDRLSEHLEIDGFRKGKVPEDIAKKHIKDELILGDMAELAVQELYPLILAEKNIDAIGRPQLAITKMARDNALGFTIRTNVLPKIDLPDYKAIAKGHKPEEADETTQEDVDKVIEELRQLRAYGHVHHDDASAHGHTEELPEVTEEFAKSFGFESIEQMREKVKENTAREKVQQLKDKRRVAIMDAILAKTTFTLPPVILQSEQERMLSQIEGDLTRAGMTIETYLEQTKKTREELLADFAPEAEKRGKFQLVINAIAKDAKLLPSEEEVEAEAEKLMQAYPGADRARSIAYADLVLTNEKVLTMLEA